MHLYTDFGGSDLGSSLFVGDTLSAQMLPHLEVSKHDACHRVFVELLCLLVFLNQIHTRMHLVSP